MDKIFHNVNYFRKIICDTSTTHDKQVRILKIFRDWKRTSGNAKFRKFWNRFSEVQYEGNFVGTILHTFLDIFPTEINLFFNWIESNISLVFSCKASAAKKHAIQIHLRNEEEHLFFCTGCVVVYVWSLSDFKFGRNTWHFGLWSTTKQSPVESFWLGAQQQSARATRYHVINNTSKWICGSWWKASQVPDTRSWPSHHVFNDLAIMEEHLK